MSRCEANHGVIVQAIITEENDAIWPKDLFDILKCRGHLVRVYGRKNEN